MFGLMVDYIQEQLYALYERYIRKVPVFSYYTTEDDENVFSTAL